MKLFVREIGYQLGVKIGYQLSAAIMLGLHDVPGGHCNHAPGPHGRNGMDVRQQEGGAERANMTGRDCRARFVKFQQICHGSHDVDEKHSRP